MITPGVGTGGGAVQIENVAGTIINPAVGFAIAPFDSIVVNYTDSTKATISTVVYKLAAATVATITLTQASTTDTYVKT